MARWRPAHRSHQGWQPLLPLRPTPPSPTTPHTLTTSPCLSYSSLLPCLDQLTKEQLNAVADGGSLRTALAAENSHQMLLVNDKETSAAAQAWMRSLIRKSGGDGGEKGGGGGAGQGRGVTRSKL